MIEIRAKFRPFSHKPGSICTIPCSPYVVEAFPTLIRVMSDGETYELHLGVTGPVKDFTQIVDIENKAVQIFGTAVEGYFSLRISHEESGIKISLDRGDALGVHLNDEEIELKSEAPILLPVEKTSFQKKTKEKLSLGSHKKLDWDLVTRRFSLMEMLPVVYALGQGVEASCPLTSVLSLEEMESLLASRFNGILTPMDRDIHHLGLGWTGPKTDGEYPTDLLRYCYESIRSFWNARSLESSKRTARVSCVLSKKRSSSAENAAFASHIVIQESCFI